MAKRDIITIDAYKCNGCGQCVPNCPEGAIQIIDGKARLVSDLFCDGLGACIGHCPEAAITIEKREAEKYDERIVMENIVRQGENVIKAHLRHLKEHGQDQYLNVAVSYLKEKKIDAPAEEYSHDRLPCECPGSKVMKLHDDDECGDETDPVQKSKLRQWPVQITLVPNNAPYFEDADLLISADCVPFAYPNFHGNLLKGKILLVGCPKLDDSDFYEKKLSQIFLENGIKSVTCVHMEVPCCSGLVHITKNALSKSGKNIPFREITVGIKGDLL